MAVSVCQALTETQFSDKMVALYSCLQLLALYMLIDANGSLHKDLCNDTKMSLNLPEREKT